MAVLRVGLAQLNLRLGDIGGNAEMIMAAYDSAVDDGAQIVVFSELAVTGYPPEDLLLKPAFVGAATQALKRIARHTGSVPAVVGFPQDTGRAGPIRLWNAAAGCWDGAVRSIFRKHLLPNYAVFDEQRYFVSGLDNPASDMSLLTVNGLRVGVSICEDLWGPPRTADAAAEDGGLPSVVGGEADTSPALEQVRLGAQLLVNLNGSPYRRGKQADREAVARSRAATLRVPVVYVNQVGGQDELVFDGGSFVTDTSGNVVCRLPAFREQVAVCALDTSTATTGPTATGLAATGPTASAGTTNMLVPPLDPLEEVWQALVVATRDYVRKNGFTDVVIGLSGGIDSSLVAAIASDALGADRVHGVSMPSRYSSQGSRADAAQLAANLGIDFRTVPIEPAHVALAEMLDDVSLGTAAGSSTVGSSTGGSSTGGSSTGDLAVNDVTDSTDLTDQNLQSRIRGLILMALSNRFGWLVLSTGNKTETSVGYTTLYGDTVGAFAVIRDVPKLLVYRLCEWRNRQGDGQRIPQACIDKPPSAELRPNQRDDQSLPPYELLDPLVEAYVEGDLSAAELSAQAGFTEQTGLRELAELHGADSDLVSRIARLVDNAEYKRRQSPPGPRITAKSFGKDRRMPITNLFD